jgi:PAS domain S-box-containing protein
MSKKAGDGQSRPSRISGFGLSVRCLTAALSTVAAVTESRAAEATANAGGAPEWGIYGLAGGVLLALALGVLLAYAAIGRTAKARELEFADAERRALLNAIPDAVVTIGPDRRIRSVNPRVYDLFGWREDELLGQSIDILVPEDLRPGHGSNVERFLSMPSSPPRSMTGYRSVPARHKDGTTFPVLVSLAKYRRHGEPIVIATVHNTTDLTTATERLLEAQDAATMGYFEWTLATDRITWSPGLRRILGYAEGDHADPSFIRTMTRYTDDPAAGRDWLDAAIRSGKTDIEPGIYRCPTKSGGAVYARVAVNIQYAQGRPDLVRGFVIDVSELIAVQEGLSQASLDAEKANAAKSEFLAAMSHDLRTPLNAILGFSDMIKQELFGPLPGKYREYAENINDSGHHLLALVNDLLDISRIDAGKLDLQRQPTDVAAVVGDAIRIATAKHGQKAVTVTKTVPRDARLVTLDERALRQILLNLLDNALKYTPDGGSVTVDAEVSGDRAVITVEDTGSGIAADDLPTITEAFARGRKNPYVTQDGWGLGLTISQSLAELHGGSLSISSTKGEGTSVVVVIPDGSGPTTQD